MNLEFDDLQSDLLEAVGTLLAKHAGPARAREVLATGGCDRELLTRLRDAGFLDLAVAEGGGSLPAELVVEQVARQAGVVPIGVRALVAPHVADLDTDVVAICRPGVRVPVRFAAAADVIIVVDDDRVGLARPEPGDLTPVSSPYGVAMASVSPDIRVEEQPGASADDVRMWWQVAIAAELVGTIGAAIHLTTEYLKERTQFGRALGSFQAIQHRMARLHVAQQGAMWLARSAAWTATPESAAAAAVLASNLGGWAPMELHQLTGAIGFTNEYDLRLWTMPVQAMRQELGGFPGHSRALMAARWGDLLPSSPPT